MSKKKAYIAAPFFNSIQIAIVEELKEALFKSGYEYFSPKDESMFKQGDNPKQILDLNCRGIITSDFMIAVTDGKDVGTMWEAGYASAYNIPILYCWFGRQEGQKFNLMLAASGGVIHSMDEFKSAMEHYELNGGFYAIGHPGDIE